MPRVTGLHEGPRGRVVVELDGAPWRTLPADVVVRAGLLVGTEVDRGRARAVGRERRRARALDAAGRALRRRDLTERAVGERLERAGVAPRDRAEAVGVLVATGVVDDGRFARARAELLAGRGRGDAAIRWDLRGRGVPDGPAEEALAALPPEEERAAAIVAERGRGAATARLLARRGFSDESVEAALGVDE